MDVEQTSSQASSGTNVTSDPQGGGWLFNTSPAMSLGDKANEVG
jgi:hypothetical protein